LRVAIAGGVLAVVIALAAASRPEQPVSTSLGVADRSNATPWIAADDEFVAVAWGGTISGGGTDVFVAVSDDSGASFGSPVRVNRVAGEARLNGEFPPRVAVRASSGGRDVVVVWNAKGTETSVRMARSSDGGRSFGMPVELQAPGARGDRGWPAVALDGDGEPHVVWIDHRGLASESSSRHERHRMSSGGDAVAMAARSSLYYSAGDGERALAKGTCYCCKTSVVASPGGAIFASWRHVYEGNIRDIAFVVSRDGGRTFGAPTRVSEDRWAIDGCPDNGPAMALDTAGIIHVVWPTVVSENGAEAGALFYATSRDGRTFSRRARVPTFGGPHPTHPQIAVSQRGEVFVAWEELRNGRRETAVRSVRLDAAGGLSAGPIQPRGSGVYPVLAATSRGILAAWTESAAGTSRIRIKRVPNDG
jgi:hypothetical protein